MWLLFLPKWLLPATQQLSRQNSATACFNNSNDSSEPSVKIVNFHPTEAGLTSKWGRISPGVYRCHQKQSIYVLTPYLNVVIVQSVWLISWKHRWRFWLFLITLFERFYTLTQLVLILYCHITHAVSLGDKISCKGQVFKIVQKFCVGWNILIFTNLTQGITVNLVPADWNKSFLLVMGASPWGHQAWKTTRNRGNGDHLARFRSTGDICTCHHIAERRTL